MKQPIYRSRPLVTAFATLFLGSSGLQAATFITTGVYDENTANTNTVDVTAAASNISLSAFTSDVAAAFISGLGGVINFENANGSAANLANTGTLTATYGASQANTLTLTSGSAGLWNSNTNNTVISGVNYLGISDQSGHAFRFSTPVQSFGITVLSRGSTQNIIPKVYFADLTFATLTPIDMAVANSDTFFGYSSPSNLIVGFDLPVTAGSANLFARVDDLGFITAPEPSSMVLGTISGLGMLGLLRRRQA